MSFLVVAICLRTQAMTFSRIVVCRNQPTHMMSNSLQEVEADTDEESTVPNLQLYHALLQDIKVTYLHFDLV